MVSLNPSASGDELGALELGLIRQRTAVRLVLGGRGYAALIPLDQAREIYEHISLLFSEAGVPETLEVKFDASDPGSLLSTAEDGTRVGLGMHFGTGCVVMIATDPRPEEFVLSFEEVIKFRNMLHACIVALEGAGEA